MRKLLPVPTLLDSIRAHFGALRPGTRQPGLSTLAPAGDSMAELAQQAQQRRQRAAGGSGSSLGQGASAASINVAGPTSAAMSGGAEGGSSGAVAGDAVGALRKGYLSVVKALLSSAAASVAAGHEDALYAVHGRGSAERDSPHDPLRFLHDTQVSCRCLPNHLDNSLLSGVCRKCNGPGELSLLASHLLVGCA